MDNTELILSQPVLPSMSLDDLSRTLFYKKIRKWQDAESNAFSTERKKQIAKDFESVLLNKLLHEMKNTIGNWGFDEDGVSKQIEGTFWLYLARDIANKGGLGLWKDIYQFLNSAEQANTTIESVDSNV